MLQGKKSILLKKLKKYAILIAAALLILTGALVRFAYREFLYFHLFDTSLNGSEIREIEHNSVPPDVAARVQSEIKHTTASASLKIPILMYHYVESVKNPDDKIRRSLTTSPYTLEQEIKTLKDAGYTFLTNAELADILDGKKDIPDKPVLLTFDDAYSDFYFNVLPLLKKYEVKVTEYVITGFTDRIDHLTSKQIIELAQSGLVEIGAHTVHHVYLKNGKLKNVVAEITQSKQELEKLTGMPVVSFAYPFGAFDTQAVRAVKEAGFRSAVSTVPGTAQKDTNRFFLYRVRPGGRIGETLLNFLNQVSFKP